MTLINTEKAALEAYCSGPRKWQRRRKGGDRTRTLLRLPHQEDSMRPSQQATKEITAIRNYRPPNWRTPYYPELAWYR